MNPYLPAGRARALARARRILALLRDAGIVAPVRVRTGAAPDRRDRRPAAAPAARGGAARRPAARGALRRSRRPGGRSRTRRWCARTLDLGLQQEVSRLTAATVRALADEGARNAAAIVLDRATGEVLAWVGSAGYFDARDAGAIDYATVSRPAGSTLKPFLYALALERGLITPATVLDDSARGPGGVENADQEFLGPLLPRFALANSRNVPAVRLLERVGLDETWAFFRDLGLHDGSKPARVYGSGSRSGSSR